MHWSDHGNISTRTSYLSPSHHEQNSARFCLRAHTNAPSWRSWCSLSCVAFLVNYSYLTIHPSPHIFIPPCRRFFMYGILRHVLGVWRCFGLLWKHVIAVSPLFFVRSLSILRHLLIIYPSPIPLPITNILRHSFWVWRHFRLALFFFVSFMKAFWTLPRTLSRTWQQ